MANAIGSVTLSSIANQLTGVYALLTEIDNSLNKLNNVSVDITASSNTAQTIAGLASLTHALREFKKLSGAGSETQMSKGIATLGTSLLALFKKIEEADIDKGVAALLKAILQISALPKETLDPSTFTGMKAAILEILGIFTSLPDDQATKAGKFAELLAAVAKLIIAMAKVGTMATQGTTLKDTVKSFFGVKDALARVMGVLKTIFKLIDTLPTSTKVVGKSADGGQSISTSFGDIASIVRALVKFSLGIPELLSKMPAVDKESKKKLNLFKTFLSEITSSIKGLATIKKVAVSFEGIGTLFTGLSSILTSFTDIAKLPLPVKDPTTKTDLITQILNALARLFNLTRDFAKKIGRRGDITTLSPVLTALGSILSEFNKLVTLITGLDGVTPAAVGAVTTKVDNFEKLLLRLGKFFSVLVNALKGILIASKFSSEAQILAITELIKASVSVIESANKVTTTSKAESIGSSIMSGIKVLILLSPFMRLIRTIIRETKDMSTEQARTIGIFLQGLGAVFNAFNKMADFAKVTSFTAVIGVFIKMKIMLPILAALIRSLAVVSGLASANQLRATGLIIQGLGQVLAGFVDISKQSSLIPNVGAFVVLFGISKILGGLIGNIAKAASKTDSAALTGVARLIRGLGQVFSGLGRTLENFSPRAFGDFKLIFGAFNDFFSQLAKATRKSKPDALLAFGQLLTSIYRILEQASASSNDTAGAGLNTQAVSQVFDTLDMITKRIGALKIERSFSKNITRLKSLFEVLTIGLGAKAGTSSINSSKAVVAILEALGTFKEGSAKFPDLRPLGKAITQLVKGLDGISTERLDAIAKLAIASKEVGSAQEALIKSTHKLSKASEENKKDTDKQKNSYLELAAKIITLDQAFKLTANGLRGLINLSLGKIFNVFEGYEILDNVGRKLLEVSQKLSKVGKEVSDLATKLLSTFSLGSIINGSGFTEAANFDDLGNKLQVFGNLTDDARKSAEAFALELGAKYPISAEQALEATLNLIKAGQTLESAQFTLPAAADLAALSDSGDLKAATTGLILAESAFANFNKTTVGTFENIASAASIIAAGADVSTASVESLNAGLANTATAANAAGLTLEETTAILAIFDQNGLKSAEGGTALSSLLTALGKPSTTNALAVLQNRVRGLGGEFKTLNLSQFNADGSRRDFTEFFRDVTKAINTLPNDKARADVVKDLADTFGQKGLGILLNQGAEAIANVTAQMRALPTAAEKAQLTLDSFKGDAAQLQGSMSTLLTVGIIPIIQKGLRPLTKIARFIVDGILGMDQSVIEFVGTMVGLAASFTTFLGIAGLVLGGLAQIGGAVFLVGAAFSAFLSAGAVITVFFTSVITGAALVVTAISVFIPLLIGITSVFESLYSVFKEDRGSAATAAGNAFQTISTVFKEIIDFGGEVIGILSDILSSGASDGLDDIGAGIAGFFGKITIALNSGKVKEFRDFITEVAEAIKGVRTLLRGEDDYTQGIGGQTEEELLRQGRGLGGFSKQINKAYLNAIKAVAKGNRLFMRLIDTNKDGITDDNEISTFAGKLTFSAALIRHSFEKITGSFSTFFTDVKKVGIGKAFSNLTGNLDKSLGDFAITLIQQVEGIFGIDLPDTMVTAFEGGFSGGINTLISTLLTNLRASILANKNDLKDIFINVMKFFFSPISGLKFISKALGIDSLTNILEGVEDILSGLFGAIFDTVLGLLEGKDIGTAIGDAFGEGITPAMSLLSALATTVGLVIQVFLKGIGEVIDVLSGGGDINSAGTGLGNFISTLANAVSVFNIFVLDPFLKGGIGGALSSIVENILPVLAKAVSDGLVGVGTFISTGISNVLSGIGDSINLSFDASKFLTDVATFISGAITALGDVGLFFAGIGVSIMGFLLTAIQSAITAIGDITGIDLAPVLASFDLAIQTSLTSLSTLGVLSVFPNFVSVLSTILSGVFSAAVGLIGAITGIDFSGVLATLDTVLNTNILALISGGLEAVLPTALSAVSGMFIALLQAGITLIGNITGIDLAGVLSTLDAVISANLEVIRAGGVSGVFALAINSITGLIVAIINSGFTAIETALGIDTTALQEKINSTLTDLFATIGDIFGPGKDGVTIFDNIAAVIKKIADAISQLFAVLSPAAQAAGKELLQDKGVLPLLVNFLGNIIAFSIDVIDSVLGGINDFFIELSKLSPKELGLLALSLSILFAVLTGPALIASLPSLAVLGASLWTVLSPIIGFVAIGSIIKGVADNVSEFFDIFTELAAGDIDGAVVQTVDAIISVAASITEGVAGLLNIEFSADAFMTMIRNLATNVSLVAGLIVRNFVNQITSIFTSISIAAELAGLEATAIANTLRRVGDGGFMQVRDAFNNNKESFSSQRFRDLFAIEGVDVNIIRGFARANADQVSAAYVAEFIAAGEVDTTDLATSETLKNFGLVGPIIDAIIATGDTGLQQDVLDNLEKFGVDQYAEIVKSFANGFATGTVPLENKDALVASLVAGLDDFSPADQNKIKLAIAQLLGVAIPLSTSTKITLKPKMVFEDADPVEVQTDVEAAIAASLSGAGEEPEVIIPLTLLPDITVDDKAFATAFDTSSLTTSEDVVVASLDVSELITKLQLLQTEFNDIVQPSLDVSATLTQMTTDIALLRNEFETAALRIMASSLVVFTALTLFFIAPMKTLAQAINDVVLALDTLNAFGYEGSPLFNLTDVVGLQTARLVSFFNAVAGSVEKLSDRLYNTLVQISAIQASDLAEGVAPNGGRAIGGTTIPGGLYQVTERESEIFEENGKKYLLSSGYGKVKTLSQGLQGLDPLQSAMNPMLAAQRPATTNLYNSSNALTVNGSPVTINVTVGAEANGTEIARQVGTQVRRELDRQTSSTKSTLRANHRNV